MKKKEIQLEDIKVTIKVLKYKQVKAVVSRFAHLVSGFLKILDTKDDNEMSTAFVQFIEENISDVEGLLFEFSDLTPESIGELYITEFPMLLKELVILHGISEETIMGFFKRMRMESLQNQPQ